MLLIKIGSGIDFTSDEKFIVLTQEDIYQELDQAVQVLVLELDHLHLEELVLLVLDQEALDLVA